ncbi:MAG: hypothetical protein LW821_15300 [Flammeovirgaceae bacterium]|jgi:4-hydroxybenzoate polyprenyltransferase|nr:hypothetical protein [Flammeovirgaceae bacterium]
MIKLFLKRFFYYLDVTSLDVFLGTLGMLAFIDFSLHANTVSFDYQLSVAVVIWLTYIADHIIDANLVKQKLLPRHSFFINNKAAIYWCIVFTFLTIPLLIFLLEIKFLIQYGVLAMVFIFCRWIFRKYSWTHSVIIALGYSIGVFSPYIYFNEFNFLELPVWMFFLMVFSFSLANIFVINFLEKEEDYNEKQITIFNREGDVFKYKNLVLIVSSTVAVVALMLWQKAGIYLLASTISIFAFGYFKNEANKKYLKPLVELSLGLPLICYFLHDYLRVSIIR